MVTCRIANPKLVCAIWFPPAIRSGTSGERSSFYMLINLPSQNTYICRYSQGWEAQRYVAVVCVEISNCDVLHFQFGKLPFYFFVRVIPVGMGKESSHSTIELYVYK